MRTTKYSQIFIACDHGGLELKNHLKAQLPSLPWVDLGTNSSASVDYPEYASKLAQKMNGQLKDSVGILICGSGQGMAIKANRYPFLRAALCWSDEVAKLARQHNDANVLCLGGRLLDFDVATKITETFLTTEFEGGRHQNRIDKLNS